MVDKDKFVEFLLDGRKYIEGVEVPNNAAVIPPGTVYACGEEKYVGKMTIRQEVEIIPADLPSSKKIGWMCHIITDEEAAERDNEENAQKRRNLRLATDLADVYKTHHAVRAEPPGNRCWTVIPVLEFLKGKPWDNMALNLVYALRPSAIRATTGQITLDAYTWRITVYLEDDERTIRKIEQEVDCGCIGIRNGQDASYYIHGNDEFIDKLQPNCIVNGRAVRLAKDKKDYGDGED